MLVFEQSLHRAELNGARVTMLQEVLPHDGDDRQNEQARRLPELEQGEHTKHLPRNKKTQKSYVKVS